MHIRESNSQFDALDTDDALEAQADDYLRDFHKRTDLDLLTHNCSAHTESAHRAYLEACER